jgi:hypothetical protein
MNLLKDGKVNDAKEIWIRDLLNFPQHKVTKSIYLEGILTLSSPAYMKYLTIVVIDSNILFVCAYITFPCGLETSSSAYLCVRILLSRVV